MVRHQIFNVPAALPEGKRRAAVELQVRKAFPFKEPAFSVFWKDTEASVYAWDDSVVADAQRTAGVAESTEVIPESYIRAPAESGVRLAKMLEGYEGQYWLDGFLRASRWWPQLPDTFEWSKFVRSLGIGLTAAEVMSDPVEFPFLERPWTEGKFTLNDWSAILQSRRLMAIAGTAALCPFLFFGTTGIITSLGESSARSELAALDKANQGIRKDRAEAFTNLDAIDAILLLNEYPSQAELLGTAMRLLAETGAPQIVSWNFDRGNLEIIARGSQDLDPAAYITLFERDPLFEKASGTFVGSERDLQLRMAVTKRVIN